jgi:hypothetical protein
MKKRLTKKQKKALDYYNLRLKEEDRYLGSVFVTPIGQRRVEAETKKAYEDGQAYKFEENLKQAQMTLKWKNERRN